MKPETTHHPAAHPVSTNFHVDGPTLLSRDDRDRVNVKVHAGSRKSHDLVAAAATAAAPGYITDNTDHDNSGVRTVSVMGSSLLLCAFLIALVRASQTNFADVACGMASRTRREGRIVGGETTKPGEFPWLVSLTKSGGHFCGGTIVNKHWVLTAAHCLCSGTDVLGTTGLRVSLGQHDLNNDRCLELPVSRVLLHPGFRCARYDSDIALLRLGAAAPWSDAVRPACFPPSGEEPLFHEAVEATVAGWGWTDESSSIGKRSNILQKVRLSIVDNSLCQEWYHSQNKKLKILDSQMCAGLEAGGKDACWADSGGPLMVGEGPEATVVGVVSTGVGCARPRLPGVYTRISSFLQWINTTISDNS